MAPPPRPRRERDRAERLGRRVVDVGAHLLADVERLQGRRKTTRAKVPRRVFAAFVDASPRIVGVVAMLRASRASAKNDAPRRARPPSPGAAASFVRRGGGRVGPLGGARPREVAESRGTSGLRSRTRRRSPASALAGGWPRGAGAVRESAAESRGSPPGRWCGRREARRMSTDRFAGLQSLRLGCADVRAASRVSSRVSSSTSSREMSHACARAGEGDVSGGAFAPTRSSASSAGSAGGALADASTASAASAASAAAVASVARAASSRATR